MTATAAPATKAQNSPAARHEFAVTAAALADNYIDKAAKLRDRLGDLLAVEPRAAESVRRRLLRGEEQLLRENMERLARIISPEVTAGGLNRHDELLLTDKLKELESVMRWTEDVIQQPDSTLALLSRSNGKGSAGDGQPLSFSEWLTRYTPARHP